MSSKDKRKSLLHNPFGFGSSTLYSSNINNNNKSSNGAKRRTILLPTDDDVITERDLPRHKSTTAGNIPKPPQPKHQGLNVRPDENQKASQSLPQPPQINVKPATTTPSPILNPIDTVRSDLSLQRSNSPGMTQKRTLVRKPPPPPIAPKPMAKKVDVPIITTDKDKPDLEKLITSIEGDVSDFNPNSAGVDSPVPSSVYSPYSPLAMNGRQQQRSTSTFNLLLHPDTDAHDAQHQEQLNPSAGNFDEEIQKIEDLLSQSTLLNQKVDHHLSHSRHASFDPKFPQQQQQQEIEASKPVDGLVVDSVPAESDIENDDNNIHPTWIPDQLLPTLIPKDPAMTNLNSLILQDDEQVLHDLSIIGSPSMIRQLNFNSEVQLETTTDDEFYDAENGDLKNAIHEPSSDERSEQGSVHHFKVVNGTPSVSPSRSDDISNVVNTKVDAPIDLSSSEPTPEPFETRTLKKRFSMDAIDGHGSDLSHGINGYESEVDYEGRDYEIGDNEDLQNRYIDQQESFYHNQQNLSPVTYMSSSPVPNRTLSASEDGSSSLQPPSIQISDNSRSIDQNTSSRFQGSTSSSSESEDQESEEENLNFTARSPFYSPFEHSDESQPRRMIITNNVSEPESDSQSDIGADLKNVVNKRDSYFGDLDINDYINEENEKIKQQQQSDNLQVPVPLSIARGSISPNDGLSNLYDRREEATVVPVTYSDPTSSAINPATSPGIGGHNLSEVPVVLQHVQKQLRRRPPPDFPVSGRSGRSLSVNQQQLPVFLENAPLSEDHHPTIDQSESLDVAKSTPIVHKKVIHPGEGVKSSYVMSIRRTAATSYSPVGPPKWTLPVAIRADSEKNKIPLSKKYSKTTMSLFKKGVLSSADIKHGNLRPRLLASEVDDEEIDKANLLAQASKSASTTTSSLAHTQLGSMVPPGRMSNELHLVHSKNNSIYSGGSGTNSLHKRHSSNLYSLNDELDFDDYMLEDYRTVLYMNSPKLDDISELNRSVSVKSYLPGAAAGIGKMRLFIANPDNEDSD